MGSDLSHRVKNLVRILRSCLLFQNVWVLYKLPFFTRKATECPICGGPAIHQFTNRYTPLDRCMECGHVYSRKLPKKRILQQTYKDFDYWVTDRKHQGINSIEYGPQWEGFLRSRIGIAERSGLLKGREGLKLFEIGCSEGMLLKELENLGHEAEGCELNVPSAEAGRAALSVKIHTEMFEDLPLEEEQFDGVLSFHTIEHVPDPCLVLDKIARILKPGGSVLIEVPCGPEEYVNTDHLQFFCEKSLRLYLEDCFREVKIFKNTYENANGTLIGSLYGVGQGPLR